MQIILNELSIENKCNDLEGFLFLLKEMIEVYQIKVDSFEILKPSFLYSLTLFDDITFQDLLTDRRYSMDDVVRRYKSIIGKLIQDEPFWDIAPLHINSHQYHCEFTTKTEGYGIAEACERERIIFSFACDDFKSHDCIWITKATAVNEEIQIHNMTSKEELLKKLYYESKLDPLTYCKEKFKNSNLSFEHLNEGYGFEIVEKDEINSFITSLEQFSKMTWQQILTSSGLNYKMYQPSSESWFRNTPYSDEKIYKFRVNLKFRCFGYRVGDVFNVLRFETDHSVSDNG